MWNVSLFLLLTMLPWSCGNQRLPTGHHTADFSQKRSNAYILLKVGACCSSCTWDDNTQQLMLFYASEVQSLKKPEHAADLATSKKWFLDNSLSLDTEFLSYCRVLVQSFCENLQLCTYWSMCNNIKPFSFDLMCIVISYLIFKIHL